MDSYTIQYSVRVRSCSDASLTRFGPFSISSTLRTYEITNLEEDSDISVRHRLPTTPKQQVCSVLPLCCCFFFFFIILI